MRISFDLALFGRSSVPRIGVRALERKESEKALLWLLETLVNIDRIEQRKFKLKPLYSSGVRYVRERPGREVWQDSLKLRRNFEGDCEDLACDRTAELRNQGKKASPYISWRRDPVTGMYIYHVMVLRPSGVEDPSRRLGMTGRD